MKIKNNNIKNNNYTSCYYLYDGMKVLKKYKKELEFTASQHGFELKNLC